MAGYCFQSWDEARKELMPDDNESASGATPKRRELADAAKAELPIDQAIQMLIEKGVLDATDGVPIAVRRGVYKAAKSAEEVVARDRLFREVRKKTYERPDVAKRDARRGGRRWYYRSFDRGYYGNAMVPPAAEGMGIDIMVEQLSRLSADFDPTRYQHEFGDALLPYPFCIKFRKNRGRPAGIGAIFVTELWDVWEEAGGPPPTGTKEGNFHKFCEAAAGTMRGRFFVLGEIYSAVQEVTGRKGRIQQQR